MSNEHAGKSLVVHDALNRRFNLQLGCVIERGGRLIKEKNQRRVRQSTRNRDALGFASGEIGDVAAGIAFQSDTAPEAVRSTPAIRTRRVAEGRIAGSAPLFPETGKGAGSPGPAFGATTRGCDLPVVCSFHVNRAASGFIEPVQQPEQGTFSGAAGTNDGQNFAGMNFEAASFDQNFIFRPTRPKCSVRRIGSKVALAITRIGWRSSVSNHSPWQRTAARNSSTISRAALRAASCLLTSNEMAPTRACPPPP